MAIDPIITMIFPANVSATWPHVSPLLAPAIERRMTHTVEDVRKAILSGQAQLWVQWNEGAEAAGVTEFQNFPLGLWLNVWLMGAKRGALVRWPEFTQEIINFAHLNGCVGIRDEGRKGLSAISPHDKAYKEAVLYWHLFNAQSEGSA